MVFTPAENIPLSSCSLVNVETGAIVLSQLRLVGGWMTQRPGAAVVFAAVFKLPGFAYREREAQSPRRQSE